LNFERKNTNNQLSWIIIGITIIIVIILIILVFTHLFKALEAGAEFLIDQNYKVPNSNILEIYNSETDYKIILFNK